MKVIVYLLAVAAVLTSGCKGLQHNILVVTGTTFGISVAENPSTQLYEAKIGYARSEFAFVPGDTNHPGTVPDVLMEIRMENILKGGLVYQRLAVGSLAVSQPGATMLFAKSADGAVDPQIAAALLKIPAPDAGATAEKLPLAQAYQQATDKALYDAVAKSCGYETFVAFLTNSTLTSADVLKVSTALKAAHVIP